MTASASACGFIQTSPAVEPPVTNWCAPCSSCQNASAAARSGASPVASYLAMARVRAGVGVGVSGRTRARTRARARVRARPAEIAASWVHGLN